MNENPTQPNNSPTIKVVASPPAPQIVSKPRSFLVPLYILFLLVSAGAIAFMLLYQSAPIPTTPSSVVTLPTPAPLFLTIDNLDTEVTAVDGEVLVSGKTLPNSTVLIYSDIDDTSLQSNPDGSFESSVLVRDAGGLVRVSAIADTGEEKSVTFDVVAATDVLGKSDTAPGQSKKETSESVSNTGEGKQNNGKDTKSDEDASDTTEEVQDEQSESTNETKEQERVVEKTSRIREFLEVKESSEKVKKIGVNKIREITTHKDSDESTDEATLKEERNEIRVQKMIAREASATATLRRSALSGVVVSVEGSSLTVVHQIQRDRSYVIHYNADTVISSKDGSDSGIPVFTVGMRVAAVGEPLGEDLLAKRIHIIPGKATGVLLKRPFATDSGVIDASPSAVVTKPATPSATMEPSPEDTATPSPSPTLEVQ